MEEPPAEEEDPEMEGVAAGGPVVFDEDEPSEVVEEP